ncbi:MAG TPA: hypothetical protein DEP36_11305 [Gammaproteobacteria bacterium]|nr:hypothetical protein [Gammaproteobacteria bacterium]
MSAHNGGRIWKKPKVSFNPRPSIMVGKSSKINHSDAFQPAAANDDGRNVNSFSDLPQKIESFSILKLRPFQGIVLF